MILESVTVGINECNCYLVAEGESAEGVVIDPGADAEIILERCSSLKLSVGKILITHCHWDHIGGVGEIKKRTSAEICCHGEDLPFYDAVVEQLAFVGLEGEPLPPVDRLLRDNEVIRVGGLSFRVIHTPGHSPGSVSYLINDVLFCGDVLFEGGAVGRTDLPGGSTSQLKDSIFKRIFSLPPGTVIYPGHGPPTTVRKEKKSLTFFDPPDLR